jgi:predicted aminopeptidase
VALEAREFAITELGLPDNGSYTRYVQLERSAVVYNVFAAPEFSLQPKTWCFPVAGCVVYRGYFAQARAEERGRSATPRRATTPGSAAPPPIRRWAASRTRCSRRMLYRDDARLAGLLFHELAHQRLYVKGDSAFNEAFATAVEEEGVRRWLSQAGPARGTRRVGSASARACWPSSSCSRAPAPGCSPIYSTPACPRTEMRAAKADDLRAARQEYEALKASWDGWNGYDRWFETPLNNARLIPSATYRGLVPAFRILLSQAGGDLEAFYAESRRLAEPCRRRSATRSFAGCWRSLTRRRHFQLTLVDRGHAPSQAPVELKNFNIARRACDARTPATALTLAKRGASMRFRLAMRRGWVVVRVLVAGGVLQRSLPRSGGDDRAWRPL